MENQQIEKPKQQTVKDLFARDDVKAKFQELLGKRSSAFITSVLQIVSSNDMLRTADPNSIYLSAAVAATLDLPLNNNLGFAYIVPYRTTFTDKQGNRQSKTVAQFQIGYKGFIQLAQRSGQFLTISAAPIYEGQLIEENPLTGFQFDFKKKDSDTVIGYAAYFKLLNGFEKTLYMTTEELTKHGIRFSQSFKKNYGLWKDDFHSMAQKTVIKLLLSKFAPLSVEMQTAVTTDQGVVRDEHGNVDYVDVVEVKLTPEEIEKNRISAMLSDCKTLEDVDKLAELNPEWDAQLFADRKEQLMSVKSDAEVQKKIATLEKKYDKLPDEEKMSEKGQMLKFEIDEMKGVVK